MASSNNGKVGQLPPPPAVVPNVDHPRDVDRMANLVGLSLCCAFVSIFVLIRAYIRVFIKRRIMLSDVTCLVGWTFTMVYAATALMVTHYGLGHHVYEVTGQDYSEVLKWLYAGSVVYIPAAYFVKVTILLLITRVFAVEERIAKGVHLFILFLLFAYVPIQTIKTMVCTPIRAYWDPTVTKFGCVNQRILFIADLTLAVLANLVIVLVPIPVTCRMRLPLRKKLKIIFMLSAGGLATGVTIFRLVKAILFLGAEDVTADFVVLGLITTCIELTIGIVCACLPSASFLYERHRSRRNHRPRNGHHSAKNISNTSWWSTVTRKTLRTVRLTAVDGGTGVRTAKDPHPALPMMQVHDGQAIAGSSTTGIMMKTCCRGMTADEACCDEAGRQAQRTFDLELALFTDQSVNVDEECRPVGSSRDASSWVNSLDGRREVWLVPKSKGGDTPEIEATTTVPDGVQRPVRYWSTIWDGTQDDIPR